MKRRVTYLLVVALLSMTMPTFATSGPDIRNLRWGLSRQEVISVETEAALVQLESGALAGPVVVAGKPAVMLCMFQAGRLSELVYAFQLQHANRNLYIDDYRQVQASLRSKYGEPVVDSMDWHYDLYKDDPSQWGRAVSRGDLSYTSLWFTQRSSILLLLAGDNYEIDLYLSYRDIEEGTGADPDTTGL